MLTAAPFEREARFERWTIFIETAISNEYTRKYVQQLAGDTLSGKPDRDNVISVFGEGGTGKGTLREAMLEAMGDYAASVNMNDLIGKRQAGGPQPDIARLPKKRLVAVDESGGSKGVYSLLKSMTGGAKISTRSHHQETFEFRPSFILWLFGDKRPQIPPDDTGAKRRLKEIPFRVKVDAPNPSLRRILSDPTQAGSAVLAWMYEGYRLLQDEGLVIPLEVAEATEEFWHDMDPLARWIEEHCITASHVWGATDKMHENYEQWAKDEGEQEIQKKRPFANELAKRGFERHNLGRKGRGFKGIGLRSEHHQRYNEAGTTIVSGEL